MTSGHASPNPNWEYNVECSIMLNKRVPFMPIYGAIWCHQYSIYAHTWASPCMPIYGADWFVLRLISLDIALHIWAWLHGEWTHVLTQMQFWGVIVFAGTWFTTGQWPLQSGSALPFWRPFYRSNLSPPKPGQAISTQVGVFDVLFMLVMMMPLASAASPFAL